MSINSIITTFTRTLFQIPGWRTKNKIVAIDSDDWGAIRMPSRDVFSKLQKAGVRVDNDPFSKYDSIASENDLAYLFEVLASFKDKNGNHPVITANCVVANPDFDKIKADNFQYYYYELITQTLDRYHGRSNAISMWKEGIRSGVFYPQYHGREHLNVTMWLHALQTGDPTIKMAFDYGLFGINVNGVGKRKNYMAAFDFETIEEQKRLNQIAEEGMNIFQQIFKSLSVSFTPPCYVWSEDIEHTLSHLGVKMIKGIPFQQIPVIGRPSYKRKIHYTGQKNRFGQCYLVRNAFFEPSLEPHKDWVDECLSRISLAFKFKKPAIIGTHRINFIGALEEKNRDKNLKLFKMLLDQILKRWPDVEFLTSDKILISG